MNPDAMATRLSVLTRALPMRILLVDEMSSSSSYCPIGCAARASRPSARRTGSRRSRSLRSSGIRS